MIKAKSNHELYLDNALKETFEETGIRINPENIVHIFDFPIYLQKIYQDNIGEYVKIVKAHGTSGSGTSIVCREDNTMLLFLRGPENGSFGNTFAGAGGSIGENYTLIYKSKFNYRTFLTNITLKQKTDLMNQGLPKLNHEHTKALWVDLELFRQQYKKLKKSKLINLETYLFSNLGPLTKEEFDNLDTNGKHIYYLNACSQDSLYYPVIPSVAYIIETLFDKK